MTDVDFLGDRAYKPSTIVKCIFIVHIASVSVLCHDRYLEMAALEDLVMLRLLRHALVCCSDFR